MPLFTGTNTFTCTSNATADACVDFIHAGLLACGFVQTATAGQLTSVTTFTSSSAVIYGFREYEINDSLSSILPVYIRVHYGHAVQGSTPGASFMVRKLEAFMALSGTTPVAPIEMPDSAPSSAVGTTPTAIPDAPVHLYKRDGLAVLIFGGMVTTANGGNRLMGAVILRRSSVGGVHLIYPPSRPLSSSGPAVFVAPGYAHTTPTVVTAAQAYINAPAAGTLSGATTGTTHALPLILGNGTGVEVMSDVVICHNDAANHYQLIDMATDISAPVMQYRVLPHALSNATNTPEQRQCVPWVIMTADRYAYGMAYLP